MTDLLDSLAWRHPARENAELYRDRDPALWAAVHRVLSDVLAGGSRTHSPVEVASGQVAYVVLFGAAGREADYMIAYYRPATPAAPVIAYCGPRHVQP